MLKFYRLACIAIIAILPFSFVHAKDVQSKVRYATKTQQQTPKNYFIRITSSDTSQPHVKIDGAILGSSSQKDATITEIHTTTPFETTMTEEYVRYMLKTDLKNPAINIQFFEDDQMIMVANGHVFDGIGSTSFDDYEVVVLN